MAVWKTLVKVKISNSCLIIALQHFHPRGTLPHPPTVPGPQWKRGRCCGSGEPGAAEHCSTTAACAAGDGPGKPALLLVWWRLLRFPCKISWARCPPHRRILYKDGDCRKAGSLQKMAVFLKKTSFRVVILAEV